MISQCFDKAVLKSVFTHPEVVEWLTDDNSPRDYEPVIHPSVIYLVDEAENGVVRFDPMNSVTCYVHIATTPEMWGTAHEFCKDARKWWVENTQYMKMVAIIPKYNKFTIRLAEDMGFLREGVIRKSFLKKWKLHDQIVLGLCKGDISCQS